MEVFNDSVLSTRYTDYDTVPLNYCKKYDRNVHVRIVHYREYGRIMSSSFIRKPNQSDQFSLFVMATRKRQSEYYRSLGIIIHMEYHL